MAHGIRITSDAAYNKAVCKCDAESPVFSHRWKAEDWGMRHMALVEQVLAHLNRGNPSLKNQRDYYQQQAENWDQPEGERRLWQALADELSTRLNESGADDEGQDALFSLETERLNP